MKSCHFYFSFLKSEKISSLSLRHYLENVILLLLFQFAKQIYSTMSCLTFGLARDIPSRGLVDEDEEEEKVTR